MDKKDRKNDFKAAYDQAYASFGGWQAAAKRDLAHYLGDIYTPQERLRLHLQQRDELAIQSIRRIIKWVSGFQRDHRKSIKYDPVEGSDEITAGQFTGLCTNMMQFDSGYETISNGFEHAIKTGLSLVNAYNDRNLDTHLDLFYYNQFLLDPMFTRVDLKDCNYGIMRKFVSKSDARMLTDDDAMINKLKEVNSKDDQWFGNYRKPTLYGCDLYPFDEFQRRTDIKKYIIILKPTGQEIEWQGTKKQLDEQLPYLLQMRGIRPELVSTVTRWIKTVEVTQYLNGEEVYHGVDPFGIGDFSFTPMVGFYDPEYDDMTLKLQGLVRCLVEPQRANSKRVASMVSWFEQQISAGLDFEEETLVDEEDAFRTGAGPRKFKKGAISGQKVRDRQTPPMPSGMLELHKLLSDSMPEMVNINPEMFGTSNDSNVQIAGVLAQLRVGSGMVGIRGLYDNLSSSQKVIGNKLLKLFQQYPWTKVQRVLGKRPSNEFYTRKFGKYDASVAEGMLTNTQRNTFYTELVQLKEMGARLNDPAPISWMTIIKNAPMQLKEELIKEIEAQQKQQQEAQKMQQQFAQALQNLSLQKLQSEINENQANAIEQQSQVQENRSNAALDRVRTAAEIQKLQGESGLALLDRAIELERMRSEVR